ncbi:MAG: hypothetical protein Phog2KO_01380 [Phototrophicaceae bacterium]
MVLISDEQMEHDITISLDEILQSDTLMLKIKDCDFHLLRLNFEKNLAYLLSTNHFDALSTNKAFSSPETIQNKQASFLILPSNATIDPATLDSIDTIFATDSQFLDQQLKSFIQLQQENFHLEQEIEQQKRKNAEIEIVKNAIVRNVSHELRTPLLQVKSAVALIGEDPSDTKLNNYAQYAVARLETHIKNITMLGHSLNLNVNPLILRDALEYSKRTLTRIWKYRDEVPHIDIAIDENLPPIMADKQGLSTVFQLLMDNALKFGEDNQIKITGKQIGDKVRVAITDDGIGIEDDKKLTIFDSFYQVDASSTRPYGGAGVGLALVKLILDYHNIDIHVDSEITKGSTFWFDIPIVDFDAL